MLKRVTKEIAQERVNLIGRELTILEWSTAKSTCKIKCNKCGAISEVKEGYYVYTKGNKCFKWKDCIGCKVKKTKEEKQLYHQLLVREEKLIDERIELAR